MNCNDKTTAETLAQRRGVCQPIKPPTPPEAPSHVPHHSAFNSVPVRSRRSRTPACLPWWYPEVCTRCLLSVGQSGGRERCRPLNLHDSPLSGPSQLSFWGMKSPFGGQSHLLYQALSCLPITRFTPTSLPLLSPLSCMSCSGYVPLPSLLQPEASAGLLEHLPPGLPLPLSGRQAQSEKISGDLELNSSIDTCCVWGSDSASEQGLRGIWWPWLTPAHINLPS